MTYTQKEIDDLLILESIRRYGKDAAPRIKHDETCPYLETLFTFHQELDRAKAEIERLNQMLGSRL